MKIVGQIFDACYQVPNNRETCLSDGLSHNHFFKQKVKMEREKTEGEKSKKMDSEKLKRKAVLGQILALSSQFRSKNIVYFDGLPDA